MIHHHDFIQEETLIVAISGIVTAYLGRHDWVIIQVNVLSSYASSLHKADHSGTDTSRSEI